jgi:hypothetical protein
MTLPAPLSETYFLKLLLLKFFYVQIAAPLEVQIAAPLFSTALSRFSTVFPGFAQDIDRTFRGKISDSWTAGE